jgi:hypothetical protein
MIVPTTVGGCGAPQSAFMFDGFVRRTSLLEQKRCKSEVRAWKIVGFARE